MKKPKDYSDKLLAIGISLSLVLVIFAAITTVASTLISPQKDFPKTSYYGTVLGASTNNQSFWDKILEFFGFERGEDVETRSLSPQEVERLRTQIRQGGQTQTAPNFNQPPPAPDRTPQPQVTQMQPGTPTLKTNEVGDSNFLTRFLNNLFAKIVSFLGVKINEEKPKPVEKIQPLQTPPPPPPFTTKR